MALKAGGVRESRLAKKFLSKGCYRRLKRDAKRAASKLRRKAKEPGRVTKGWL